MPLSMKFGNATGSSTGSNSARVNPADTHGLEGRCSKRLLLIGTYAVVAPESKEELVDHCTLPVFEQQCAPGGLWQSRHYQQANVLSGSNADQHSTTLTHSSGMGCFPIKGPPAITKGRVGPSAALSLSFVGCIPC